MSDAASAPLTPEQIRELAAKIGIGALAQGIEANRAILKDAHDALREYADLLDSQALALTQQQRELADLKARIAAILPHRYDGGAEPRNGTFPCFYCGGTLDSQQHADDCVWLQSAKPPCRSETHP